MCNKDNVYRIIKQQLTEWEKIFTNILDKGLMVRTYSTFLKPNNNYKDLIIKGQSILPKKIYKVPLST
jgi:hypothetical protein